MLIKKFLKQYKNSIAIFFVVILCGLVIEPARATDNNLLLEPLATYLNVSISGLSLIDTDNDGYDDAQEILADYSPFNSRSLSLQDSDVDNDDLSDYWELLFRTNPKLTDTDNDGYSDYQEISYAYDPLSTTTKKLNQKVEIDRKSQTLFYYVSGHLWREFSVSTGKPSMPTPSGEFTVVNKIQKAWSKTYSLWMPFWLGLDRGSIGIHELPVWPSGYREGEDHLGQAVSHGCIRLGVGPAQYMFDRLDVGAKVFIK